MEIKHFDLIVDGILGAFAPKVFAKRFPAWLDDEEQAILRAGPDNLEYWETWEDVTRRAYEDQSLYSGESGDVFILTDSPLNAELQAWSSGEYLENCPKWLREMVAKLAEEFITDRPDEFISEDEALQHFSPSKYNDDLVNKALEWMRAELRERM